MNKQQQNHPKPPGGGGGGGLAGQIPSLRCGLNSKLV